MILNINLTITLCYEKEFVAHLTLLNDDILRLFEQGHNIVDKKIYDVLVSIEYLIGIDSAGEDVGGYLLSE